MTVLQRGLGRPGDMNKSKSLIDDRLEDQTAGLRALAHRYAWRLVVLFGSAARNEAGRDLDLAVLPRRMPSLLEQGRWQAELEALFDPIPVDLLMLGPDLSAVTRFQVFRDGKLLVEAESGLFERERDRAFFLHADSEWIRRQQRELLRVLAR